MGRMGKHLKRWLAIGMAVALMMQNGNTNVMTVSAEGQPTEETSEVEETEEETTEEEPTTEEEKPTEEEPTEEESAAEEPTEEEPTEEELASEEEEPTEEEPTREEEPTIEEEETTEEETTEEETTEEETTEEEVPTEASEIIYYNTGSCEYSVVSKEDYDYYLGDCYFDEDGSYTIEIPETDPFFPYEVQFTYEDETFEEWFMSPDDSIEVGGHTFYVSADFTGDVVTQMTLTIAGKKVIVYPEEKTFTSGKLRSVQLYNKTSQYLTVDLSDFNPIELTQVEFSSVFTGDNELTDTDKIAWSYYSGDENITVSASDGVIDLSYNTYYSSSNTWQMIVGDGNQLDDDAVCYYVEVYHNETEDWLTPTVYGQDSSGNRKKFSVSSSSYYDYPSSSYGRELYVRVSGDDWDYSTYGSEAYVSLAFNSGVFSGIDTSKIKVYEGKYTSASEAAKSGTDITSKIFSTGMSSKDAGYKVSRYNTSTYITMVQYDSNGNAIGCLPFYIYMYSTSSGISPYSLYKVTDSSTDYAMYSYSSSEKDGVKNYTLTLYKGYAADDKYALRMAYYKDSTLTQSAVTAAYIGKYTSASAAKSAGATDVTSSLFSESYAEGYTADYSDGVYFSIFTEDGSSYIYCIKTVEGSTAKSASSGTSVYFSQWKDKDGNYVDAYTISSSEDSYAEFNWITVLMDDDVDLTSLAPEFTLYDDGEKLYAAGSSTAEVSGESYHDFSNGPVQYTVSAEDGENAKNYWVQVVKPTSGTNLYINSLADDASETTTKNGVVYSTREVMLDSYHDDVHDIIFANMGGSTLKNISAELSSDVLEVSDYWTFDGEHDLVNFDTATSGDTTVYSYYYLDNLAQIRLKAKDGATQTSDDLGTLTIKADGSTIMVLTLTGTIGDPTITTTEIPDAVKYVPYGTMIQNNNKYSWNTVSYTLLKGSLPEGVELKSNGELYGVPKETGTFEFTVYMKNSSGYFSNIQKTFTMTVLDNTDANVKAAIDEGYELTESFTTVGTADKGTRLLVSSGVYSEFVTLYLDGDELELGTDYTAESGSTRITIKSETLSSKSTGKHTLGIEFRDSDDSLKASAMNYTVEKSSTGSSSGSNSSSSDEGSTDDSSSNSSSTSTATATEATILPGAGKPVEARTLSIVAVYVDGTTEMTTLDSYIDYAREVVRTGCVSSQQAVVTVQALMTTAPTDFFMQTVAALAELKGTDMVVNHCTTVHTTAYAQDAYGNNIAAAGIVENVTTGSLVLLMGVHTDGTVEIVEGVVDPVTGIVMGIFEIVPEVITVLVLA